MDSLLQATAPLLAEAFTLWGSPTTWLEVAGFVLSVWMVLCNMRVNPMGWPLAIVSSLLYALLFAHSKLYGEASLQLFFVAVAGWGWWQWLRGHDSEGGALKVHRMSATQKAIAAVATLAAWPLLALALARFTDSDVPWLDALPTVGSIAGQFLLGRKLIENWPVWLAVNLVSLALFGVKGLWLTVALYAVFALLSVAGWRAWAKMVPPGSLPVRALQAAPGQRPGPSPGKNSPPDCSCPGEAPRGGSCSGPAEPDPRKNLG